MEFTGSVHIARRPDEVFAMLADVQDFATGPGSPIAAMEKLPAGPTAVGTRWREVVKLGPWLTMTLWSEVTAIESPWLLAERFWGGSMRGTLLYRLESVGADSTILRQQESLEAVGWLRPFGWIVDRVLPPQLSQRLLDIRDQLERELQRR